jgi:GGDEF domain-containing protein
MNSRREEQEETSQAHTDTLLTLSNIQYLVEGLDSLLHTNLDGDKRAKVIKLRDELSAYIGNMFSD